GTENYHPTWRVQTPQRAHRTKLSQWPWMVSFSEPNTRAPLSPGSFTVSAPPQTTRHRASHHNPLTSSSRFSNQGCRSEAVKNLAGACRDSFCNLVPSSVDPPPWLHRGSPP